MRASDGESTGADLGALLSAASAGDESAWESLVRLYARRIFALARSRCGSDDAAEEITQSVFVTVATKVREGVYTEQGKFEAWLFRVAMNRVRDAIRKNRRRKELHDRGAEAERTAAPNERETSDDLAALRGAILRLSEPDREIIELRHHAGMGFKEMAELLGEPIGTLLARHHRALRKLRDLLATTVDRDLEGTGGR